MAMDCKNQNQRESTGRKADRKSMNSVASVILSLCALWFSAGSLRAQVGDEEDRTAQVPVDQLRKAKEVMDTARKIGPWENQVHTLDEATDNMFKQEGGDSESDQFAKSVMHEVGRVPPWDAAKRQEVFLQHIQSRYNLTHDQVKQFDGDFQREGMRMAMKHFATVAPVILEIAKTRAADEPFTPEQVQRWTQAGRPIMDDMMDSMDRVTGKLRETMTADQREALEGDMKAFRRRHSDMKRMAEKGAAGQWPPADWGLQNDPIHAGQVAKAVGDDARKTELVEKVVGSKRPDEDAVARDESEWDKYVKWFCNNYHCEERQRTTADAILKGAKRTAVSYLSARRDVIEQAQARVKTAGDAESRKRARDQQDKVLEPVIFEFERMKKRLYEEVLTSEQRRNFTPPAKTAKADKTPSD